MFFEQDDCVVDFYKYAQHANIILTSDTNNINNYDGKNIHRKYI